MFAPLLQLLACSTAPDPTPEDAVREPAESTRDDTADSAEVGAEIPCNGLDDDGDGLIDEEGIPETYVDNDGDGYGYGPTRSCPGEHAATVKGDCDDADPLRNPGTVETCNAVDDDCDRLVDEGAGIGCLEGFADEDGDGFGGAAGCFCTVVDTGGDCDDTDPALDIDCTATPVADLPSTGIVVEGTSGLTWVGDCTGDGEPDLTAWSSLLPGPLAAGSWSLEERGALDTTATDDWTGDGVCDALYYSHVDATFSLTDGATGVVLVSIPLEADSISGARPTDLDGDGSLDVVLYREYAGLAAFYIFNLETGLSRICDAAPYGEIGSTVRLPDLDGDGLPEVDSYGEVRWSPATDSFCGSGEMTSTGLIYSDTLIDFDGDGRLDFVGNTGTGHLLVAPAERGVLDPANAIVDLAARTMGSGMEWPVVGDADGDGIVDLVVLTRWWDGGTDLRVWHGPLGGTLRQVDVDGAWNLPDDEVASTIAIDEMGVRFGAWTPAGGDSTRWLRL